MILFWPLSFKNAICITMNLSRQGIPNVASNRYAELVVS